jgi:hypothetical protein
MSSKLSLDVEIDPVNVDEETIRGPGVQIGEAVEIYGDAKVAVSYRYVSRRCVSFLSFARVY